MSELLNAIPEFTLLNILCANVSNTMYDLHRMSTNTYLEEPLLCWSESSQTPPLSAFLLKRKEYIDENKFKMKISYLLKTAEWEIKLIQKFTELQG